jgi:uracil-DNA glycosylase
MVGHDDQVSAGRGPTLVCSFHPNRLNAFTRRVTEEMLDEVVTRAVCSLRGDRPRAAASSGNRGVILAA